MTDIIGSC